MCVHFVDEDSFEYISLLPKELRNKTFCINCYNQDIETRLSNYQNIADKSKNVEVFTIKQTKETRKIRKSEPPLHISDCDDREETLLKLAFLAAERGFNTLVDVDIRSKKIGSGKSYKKLIWDGTGIPVKNLIKS